MIGRLSISRFGSLAFAALLAASGVSMVRAESPVFSISSSATDNYMKLRLVPQHATEFGADKMAISMTDPSVGVRTEDELSPSRPALEFENVTAGQTVAIDGYLTQGGVTNAETHALQLMGVSHDDDWMHETPETFTEKAGDPDDNWSGRDLAQVADGRIAIDTQAEGHPDWAVTCTVGDLPDDMPRTCRGFTVRTSVAFSEASDDPPEPEGRPLGLTITCLDEDNPTEATFAFVENDEWRTVPVATCDPTVSTNWQVCISVDLMTSRATYFVRPAETNAWVLIGTAENVEAGDVTKASFLGQGALDGLEGHGFDTQLLQIDVTFGTDNLKPGCNFEETTVTGNVTITTLHAATTEHTTGKYVVKVVDIDGTVVVVQTNDYSAAIESSEFVVKATDLDPGRAYVASVVFVDSGIGEMNEINEVKTSVMGRSLTNEYWSVDGSWFYEDVDTFNGDAIGSGIWTTNGVDVYGTKCVYATTSNDWIWVRTISNDIDFKSDAAVEFTPTNSLEETASYTVSFSALFPEPTDEPDPTDAVFGCTVSKGDEGLQFYCVSNGTWCAVPLSTFAPDTNVEYRLTVFAQIKDQTPRLDYFLNVDGGVVTLMTVSLEGDYTRLIGKMDVRGYGAVADLAGQAYSTELLRLKVDFDADTLAPGTNFTETTANGTNHFVQLWETDHTNGYIRVLIRDKWGLVVGYRRISFHGLDDIPFDYFIQGLQPGETYTVSVEAEVNGITTAKSDDFREGRMVRYVTNEAWAVAEEWIRENADTFNATVLGTGVWRPVWDDESVLAVATNEFITVNTTTSDDTSAIVGFTATNALPAEHTGFEIRSSLLFDMPCTSLPTLEGSYGVTLVSTDPDASEQHYQFAIVSNGVWTTVDCGVYEPLLGVEYTVVINVDTAQELVTYSACVSGEVATVLAEYDLDSTYKEDPAEAVYRGVGRMRTFEGDGLDTALVRISADFDEDLLSPGTNFASTIAAGKLCIRQFWMTDKTSGTYTIYLRDAHGNLAFEKTLTYSELTNQNFSVDVTNLVAGGVYDVLMEATLDGENVGSDWAITTMARYLGTWINEDAETFLGEREGTGIWLGTNETASVVGEDEDRSIQIATIEDESPVVFNPTNDSLSVRCSTLREIRMNLTFSSVGWYSTEQSPSVSSNALAAVTTWCDDSTGEESDDNYAVAVLSNGTWAVIEETRRHCSLAEPCEVTMLIDYMNGYVRYDVCTGSYSNRVCQYDFEPEHRTNTVVKFVGGGLIQSIDGDTWDPNLITSATNEFATLDEAILGSNEDETLSPLWLADQTVTVDKGNFRIYDPNNWLHVSFPTWYYVVITEDGDHVKVYKFNRSNNWIDYAEDGDANIEILEDGALFLVHTPEGLSWIAAQATNEWISGRIELAGDIDLTKHNWTPIAGFSGTFDGCGRTIDGLNNTNKLAGIPRGEYIYGPTNEWGRSTYGLFGTATNATLTGVTFANVAISNLADSVAALVGALAGNCAVSNVTVESGSILGLGGTAAGLAGFADFGDFLTFVGNTNGAAVATENLDYGAGRWTAGLLCVAGPTDPAATLGTVVVTNNANYGTVRGSVYDTDLLGGNIAQILAGTTLGARFGDVYLTDNLAAGEVDFTPVRSDGNNFVVTNYPAVNLAPAFWGSDEDGVFRIHLDANVPGAVAVDPCYRTARMLSGYYSNGTSNLVGLVNDAISACAAGDTVTLPADLESWGAIVLDRDLIFDLDGHEIYTVYVNNTFVISNGVEATVQNGTISVGEESTAFVGDTNNLHQVNLTVQSLPLDFYQRTAQVLISTPENPDGEPISLLYKSYIAEVLNYSQTTIQLYSDSDVEIDIDKGTLSVNGYVLAQLKDCYGFKVVNDGDGTSTKFVVNISDTAAPTVEFTMTGGAGGQVSVSVGNAQPGFYYALQKKASLVEEWTEPAAEDWVLAESDSLTLTAATDGTQGYYRVMMTDVNPDGSGSGSGGDDSGSGGDDSGDDSGDDDGDWEDDDDGDWDEDGDGDWDEDDGYDDCGDW